MNWLLWLFIGVVIGWLIEFVIDYLFWQKRYSQVSVELGQMQGRVGNLESRALAAERDAKTSATKLSDAQSSLEKVYADLTGAHTIQETLRKNIQVLEDRVDNWGRKIGLLASAEGVTDAVGSAFSQDDDVELKTQLELLGSKLSSAAPLLVPSVSVAPTSVSNVVEQAHDPLHEIKGIGAVYEQRLNDAGIFTFAELVATDPRRIHEIINPKDWQTIDLEDWLAQARLLMSKDGQQ